VPEFDGQNSLNFSLKAKYLLISAYNSSFHYQ